MIKQILCILLSLTLVVSLTSCATLMHGPNQRINLNSTPVGAKVTVNGKTVITPGYIVLKRSVENYELVFEKDGYEPIKVNLFKTTDGFVWGNILLGGIIGIGIDFATGSAYKLTPGQVNVVLESKGMDYSRIQKPASEDILIFSEKPKESKPKQTIPEEVINASLDSVEEKAEEVVVSEPAIEPLPAPVENYRNAIIERIKTQLPPNFTPLSQPVWLHVSLLKSGAVKELGVLKDRSNSDKEIQRVALKSVDKALPMPAFPADISDDELNLDIPIN